MTCKNISDEQLIAPDLVSRLYAIHKTEHIGGCHFLLYTQRTLDWTLLKRNLASQTLSASINFGKTVSPAFHTHPYSGGQVALQKGPRTLKTLTFATSIVEISRGYVFRPQIICQQINNFCEVEREHFAGQYIRPNNPRLQTSMQGQLSDLLVCVGCFALSEKQPLLAMVPSSALSAPVLGGVWQTVKRNKAANWKSPKNLHPGGNHNSETASLHRH